MALVRSLLCSKTITGCFVLTGCSVALFSTFSRISGQTAPISIRSWSRQRDRTRACGNTSTSGTCSYAPGEAGRGRHSEDVRAHCNARNATRNGIKHVFTVPHGNARNGVRNVIKRMYFSPFLILFRALHYGPVLRFFYLHQPPLRCTLHCDQNTASVLAFNLSHFIHRFVQLEQPTRGGFWW